MRVHEGVVGVILFLLVGGGFCENNETEYLYGEMNFFANSTLGDPPLDKMCILYSSDYPLSSENTTTTRYKLENFTDINPCDTVTSAIKTSSDKTRFVLFMQGFQNCSLIHYLNFAEGKNASGLVILAEKRLNSTGSEGDTSNLDILVYISSTVSNSKKINDLIGKEPYVEFRKLDPETNRFEWSTAILGLLACFCVAVGSLTAPYYEPHKSSSTHQQILDGDANDPTTIQPQANPMEVFFNVKLALVMVVFISTVLMLLYFFFEYLVYFFMVVFAIASGRALFEIISQLLNLCLPDDVRIPKIKGFGIHKWILAGVCIALPITWFVLRHTKYIWILEDILGVCFCIHLIQSMKLPNLKICTVLLSLLFVYDIFFVFITPYLTSNGKSIMVEVATGAGSGETLPLLLQIPRLRHSTACSASGFSLLGFGDIILPGFLVSFSNAYDIARRDKNRPYFITAMLGYVVGLTMAFIALYLTSTGQPALLYLVPCTLIPLFIVSAVRKQFSDIWLGVVRN